MSLSLYVPLIGHWTEIIRPHCPRADEMQFRIVGYINYTATSSRCCQPRDRYVNRRPRHNKTTAAVRTATYGNCKPKFVGSIFGLTLYSQSLELNFKVQAFLWHINNYNNEQWLLIANKLLSVWVECLVASWRSWLICTHSGRFSTTDEQQQVRQSQALPNHGSQCVDANIGASL